MAEGRPASAVHRDLPQPLEEALEVERSADASGRVVGQTRRGRSTGRPRRGARQPSGFGWKARCRLAVRRAAPAGCSVAGARRVVDETRFVRSVDCPGLVLDRRPRSEGGRDPLRLVERRSPAACSKAEPAGGRDPLGPLDGSPPAGSSTARGTRSVVEIRIRRSRRRSEPGARPTSRDGRWRKRATGGRRVHAAAASRADRGRWGSRSTARRVVSGRELACRAS